MRKVLTVAAVRRVSNADGERVRLRPRDPVPPAFVAARPGSGR